MISVRDIQELAVAELEAIPTMSDRELLEGIAERLVVLELQQKMERESD